MNRLNEDEKALIQRWRVDQRAFYRDVADKFHVRVPSTHIEQMLDDAEVNIHEILLLGLDIGTIIEYVIPVTLRKHSEHGWIFVDVTNGIMYGVRDRV